MLTIRVAKAKANTALVDKVKEDGRGRFHILQSIFYLLRLKGSKGRGQVVAVEPRGNQQS